MLQEQLVAGLTPSRLEQLCRPEQVEHTMYLLFNLNHWAKARDRLFFTDRQGLYEVKTALLRQAYRAGQIIAYAYIDGTTDFGAELAIDMAADLTAEGVLWRLENLSAASTTETRDRYSSMAAQFYTRMTGKEVITAVDLEALETEQVEDYVRTQLKELENEARATRQPIPCQKLMELCIAPGDLLCITDHRCYDLGSWDNWDQLDASDLRKLDPEGLSLIAFHYLSPVAHYVFHQPFRLAETFLPGTKIAQLQRAPWTSRENGEYYGRAITETESLQQPVAALLGELGVDIPAVCPHLLSDKQEHTLVQALRHAAWSETLGCCDDEKELDDELWQKIYSPRRKRKARSKKTRREPGRCPLCSTQVNTPAIERIEHWQQAHSGQDLTFSQVSWVLNRTTAKKRFCQEYFPDYRAPHKGTQGTRYWRLETLLSLMKKATRQEEQL